MSLVGPQAPQGSAERKPSPILPPATSSVNNPFRKNGASPVPLSPRSPVRPSSSRNPFLDRPFGMDSSKPSQRRSNSPRHAATGSDTDNLLGGLTLSDNKFSASENMPPPPRPVGHHHPSHSQEEGRRVGRPPNRADTLDIFADPPNQRNGPSGPGGERRPRRNSDTSIADSRRSIETEEERRRRHRERRPRLDAQGRPIPQSSSKSRRGPSRRLDIIDKLDVTSIYGTGLFHHDGPFDALNPHRNRKGAARAPMQAFPKDSMNNTLGGSGPVNKNIDIARFHGHQEDSFSDFNTTKAARNGEPYLGVGVPSRRDARDGVDRTSTFVPASKIQPIHGDESLGLGTSTFLEGAPAARSAIEQRDSEPENIGISRKKSIAQKIRGISNSTRPRGNSGNLGSPETRYDGTRGATSPEALSGGGKLAEIKEKETNPFFEDYDEAYDKKGTSIRVAEDNLNSGTSSAAVTPGPSTTEGSKGPQELKRAVTEGGQTPTLGNLASSEQESSKSGGGFLSRVKSLRGGGLGKGRSSGRQA